MVTLSHWVLHLALCDAWSVSRLRPENVEERHTRKPLFIPLETAHCELCATFSVTSVQTTAGVYDQIKNWGPEFATLAQLDFLTFLTIVLQQILTTTLHELIASHPQRAMLKLFLSLIASFLLSSLLALRPAHAAPLLGPSIPGRYVHFADLDQCPDLKPHEPRNSRDVRLDNIGVVMALGDSITAGFLAAPTQEVKRVGDQQVLGGLGASSSVDWLLL